MFETNVFSTSPPMLQGDIVGATDHTPDENEFQMTIIPSARIIFMCVKFNKQLKMIIFSLFV